MDISDAVAILHGWLFILVAFAGALGIAMFRGRQALINLTVGSYLGLLLYQYFPYFDEVTKQVSSANAKATISLLAFAGFTVLSALFFSRLMPREFLEGAFESMGKKILLAIVATIVTLTFANHYLPVAEIANIGVPLPEVLFLDKYAFIWLVLPLVALFILA